jgi:stage II sporulation protein D
MNLCRRFSQMGADEAVVFRRLLMAILLLLSNSVFSQAPNVRVRLYSLHSEEKIKVTAKNGELVWKPCEKCEAKHAASVIVEASPQGLKISQPGASPPQHAQHRRELGTPGASVLSIETSKQVFIEGDYRVEPGDGLTLGIKFPLEIRADGPRLKVFMTLPMEDYVAAALAGESGNFQQQESLKAMAVAVRSYAAHFRQRHGSEGFDFCDSTHCQTLNFKGISPRIRAAVEATRGEMLWHEGSPAATFYHQNCGGTIAAAHEAWPGLRAPYLKQQADVYCIRGTPLPWKAQLDRRQLETALRSQGLLVPEQWSKLEIVSRTPSGRVLKLAFRSPAGDPQLISASSLRFAIGRSFGWNQVRSDLYDIVTTNDSVIFSGRGAGHGVGLCQAGAEEMAREGKSYKQILAFYYPGASLGVSAKGLAWQARDTDRFQLLSVQPEEDADVLSTAQKILPALESDLGWKLDFKPQLKVYPTLDTYRDSTGQPGWIAAFTRGHTISLQPTAMLEKKSALESTLRHEFTHLLIEQRAHAGTPLWFREGLALYFADANHNSQPLQMTEAQIEQVLENPQDRERIERGYAAARTRVGQMIQQNGRETVLLWLTNGLPAEKPYH